MPYIKTERRKEMDVAIEALSKELLSNDGGVMGDFNYAISNFPLRIPTA